MLRRVRVAVLLLTLGGAAAYTPPAHSPAAVLGTVQQLLDGDIDLDSLDLKRGGPDWHAFAIDGFVEEPPILKTVLCRDLGKGPSVNNVGAVANCDDSRPAEPTHTASDLLAERLLSETKRRHLNFVTPADKQFGNGTVDLARSFISVKWHTPADIECPLEPKLQTPRPSYSTQPCRKAWLTGKYLEQALLRMPEFLVMVPPDAGFAISANDRSVQVLLRGGFDFESIADMLGMHVAWYSAPKRFLHPSDVKGVPKVCTDGTDKVTGQPARICRPKVCTHILPTPYETKLIGEIFADEDVVASGGRVYWASEAGIDSVKQMPDYLVGTVPPFRERVPTLFYRGSEGANPEARGAIYDLGKFRINQRWLNATRNHAVEIQEFGSYKYVVDIGSRSGTTAAALSNKMRLGSLVFLVESGFADWWHGGLVAGEHYVAVNGDLSDLHKQYLWAEAHPEDALRIAEAGRAYAIEARSIEAMDAHVMKVAKRMIDNESCNKGVIDPIDPILGPSIPSALS